MFASSESVKKGEMSESMSIVLLKQGKEFRLVVVKRIKTVGIDVG